MLWELCKPMDVLEPRDPEVGLVDEMSDGLAQFGACIQCPGQQTELRRRVDVVHDGAVECHACRS